MIMLWSLMWSMQYRVSEKWAHAIRKRVETLLSLFQLRIMYRAEKGPFQNLNSQPRCNLLMEVGTDFYFSYSKINLYNSKENQINMTF